MKMMWLKEIRNILLKQQELLTGKFKHAFSRTGSIRTVQCLRFVIIFTRNGADIYFLLFIIKLISRRSRFRELFELFQKMNFAVEDEL